MGLVHYVFMIVVVLFLIVSLSSCNMTGNVVLKNVPPIVDVEEVFRGRLIY